MGYTSMSNHLWVGSKHVEKTQILAEAMFATSGSAKTPAKSWRISIFESGTVSSNRLYEWLSLGSLSVCPILIITRPIYSALISSSMWCGSVGLSRLICGIFIFVIIIIANGGMVLNQAGSAGLLRSPHVGFSRDAANCKGFVLGCIETNFCK